MNKQKEIQRIKKILKVLPRIRKIINAGGGWDEIKFLCEPLGLSDTAFILEPTLDDYLMDKKYWQEKLKRPKIQKQFKVIWEESRSITITAKNAGEAKKIFMSGDFSGAQVHSNEMTAGPRVLEITE